MPTSSTDRTWCPKCRKDGRPDCTRFHWIKEGRKQYLRCERVKKCGWRREIKFPPARRGIKFFALV